MLIATFATAAAISTFFCIEPAGFAQSKTVDLRVVVQGDTRRLPDFVESLRREFKEKSMSLVIVERDAQFDYHIILAQESSLGGAAAAVVVLDSKAAFVASVVRSGRFSGKGAFNASAKELAKKIAILRGVG
jgi:hypothetical protein